MKIYIDDTRTAGSKAESPALSPLIHGCRSIVGRTLVFPYPAPEC